MSRFDTIAQEYRAELVRPDGQGYAQRLLDLEIRLQNQAAQEAAELSAYKICGCCHRIYSKEAWSALPASVRGLLRRDAHELQEVRTCQTPILDDAGALHPCGAPLVVVRQVYGGQPLQNSRRLEEVSGEACECSSCRKEIVLGDSIVVRTSRTSGLQQGVRQIFCAPCEEHVQLAQKLEVKPRGT